MHHVRTLTVVKTDLQGFSRRVESMTSGQLDEFLRLHRELVAGVLKQHGGEVVKEMGDSILATFQSSTQALLASIELQRQASARALDGPLRAISIRVMLAAGDVIIQPDGDVFGPAVNAVSRIESFTPPGAIHFSESVYQNCNHEEIGSEVIGDVALEGFSQPVRLHRTTFRHQTRELPDTTALVTDVTGFHAFALHAELQQVEALMEGWDRAHEEAAAAHNGVIRLRNGEWFVLTFSSVSSALRGWLLLRDRAATVLTLAGEAFPLDFRVGLAVGTVRVFKHAVYGEPFNWASRYEILGRDISGGPLITHERIVDDLSDEDRALISVHSLAALLDMDANLVHGLVALLGA